MKGIGWGWGGGGKAQHKPEELGRRLDSLKESLLIPQIKKMYGGLARIAAKACPLYIPKGILFLFTPINLATMLKLPQVCLLKFFSCDTARTHFLWQQNNYYIAFAEFHTQYVSA